MSLQAEERCFEAYEHLAVVWRAAEMAQADHAAVDVEATRAGIARLHADLDAGREPRLPGFVWRGPP